MKKYTTTFSFLLLIVTLFFTFYSEMPSYHTHKNIPITQFSTKRALSHLKVIADKPHYCGTTAHTEVRNYIIKEFQKLGLEVSVQEQEAVNSKWQGGVKTYNILARIKGTDNNQKALLLLSHYDSTPHSSYGGSDAGSGVVTIMETVRAYIASGKKSKNDIIILITDAEELGLLGAKAFVAHHNWAKDIGLVLNLEARGSGGPSYMLLETNGGNHDFIAGFQKANTPYPVSNSLMYSIYKMLPNDTDLTIFRELGDIDGFNFAFIDDFYDYHTALDTYERLDPKTLEHQGTYMMTLLDYFANTDLTNLKSQKDDVFFNFPLFGVVYYPFYTVIPLAILLSIVFLMLFRVGVRKRKLSIKKSLMGFIPFVISLVSSLLLGIFGWKLILFIFPQYQDIQHGFPYNGQCYVNMFISLMLGILFFVYTKYKQKILLADLMVAPLFFLSLFNLLVAFKLKGGGFLIIPLLSLLISWAILLFSSQITRKHLLLFTLLSLPTLIIFSPLITMFPIGLGLKMIGVSLVFVVLIFGSLLSVFGNYTNTKYLSRLFFAIAILAFFAAAFKADYTVDRKQPNSIVFVQNTDTDEAFYGSYNRINDLFTRQFLGNTPQKGDLSLAFSSKFGGKINLHKNTFKKDIPIALINKHVNDSLFSDKDVYTYDITAQRDTNLFYICSKKPISFYNIRFNGEEYLKINKEDVFAFTTTKENTKIISYYLADGLNNLQIEFEVAKGVKPELELFDISFNLMNHQKFKITPRAKTMMPSPFIINDAIILKKSF